MDPKKRSSDKAAQEMIQHMADIGLENAWDRLEAQLPHIRAQGYALDAEENEVGVNCIATTVLDGFGEVTAAISVTGPSNRWNADTIAKHAEDVISAANRISKALGYKN